MNQVLSITGRLTRFRRSIGSELQPIGSHLATMHLEWKEKDEKYGVPSMSVCK
jgi:hypothetical protein